MTEDAPPDQDQARARVQELERQLDEARNALAGEQAEAARAKEQAAALAASLDESHVREMELEEVVRAETARRERLGQQLTAERAQREVSGTRDRRIFGRSKKQGPRSGPHQ